MLKKYFSNEKQKTEKSEEQRSQPEVGYYDFFVNNGGTIGTGCEIFPEVFFGSEPYLITIGNNVRLTNGVKFVTHDGGLWTLRKMKLLENADSFGRITVGDNTHIGWDVTIMPGVSIGKNCVIGCNAVVTRDIPDNSVAAGVPARVIKSINQYYEEKKDKVDFTKDLSPEEKKLYLEDKYKLRTKG